MRKQLRHRALYLICGGIAVVLVSCASTEGSPGEEQISEWLREDTRSLVVRTDPILPYPSYQTRTSRTGKGAGEGAKEGAAESLRAGAESGSLGGLFTGVILMPVFALGGAIYGAADAEPIVDYHPIETIRGAPALFEAVDNGNELRSLLSEKLVARSGLTSHALRPTEDDQTVEFGFVPEGADALMTLGIDTISLLGEVEEDPKVRLVLTGFTHFATQDGISAYWDKWAYEGGSRKLSEWAADDAKLFRGEFDHAADSVAQAIVACLPSNAETVAEGRSDKSQALEVREC